MKSGTTIKSALVGLTATAMLVGATTVSAAGKLNVSNWAEYMAEDTIENFAEEYDIEVTFTPYDSVEAIDSKLLAGNSGYDVVSHAASQAARLIKGRHPAPDRQDQTGKLQAHESRRDGAGRRQVGPGS